MDSNGIGNKIRDLRNQKRLTQKDLADELSVASSTISHWEKGRRLPSISELRRIAEYFKVTLNSFEYHYDHNRVSYHNAELVNTTQFINVYSPGFKSHSSFFYIYVFGLIVGLFSIKFESSWSEAVLLIGCLIMLVPILNLSIHILNSEMKTTKKLAAPSSTIVYYENDLGEQDVSRFKKKMILFSQIMVFSSIILHGVISLLLAPVTEPILALVIVLYGLMVITMTYLRYLNMMRSPVLKKQVDYDQTPRSLSHITLYFSLMIDLFTFAILILFIARFGSDTPFLLRLFASLLALVQALISYSLIRDYQSYIKGFHLFMLSTDQNITRII